MARFAVYFAFVGVLLVLAAIDLDTKRLPDVITLPSIPIFFLAGFATHEAPWLERAIGAAGGYLAVRLVSDAYYAITRREGLGLGDGKVLAVVGALLGWRALPFVIFLASFIGILVSVPLILWARRGQGPNAGAKSAGAESPDASPGSPAVSQTPPPVRHAEVPFGPFLALSAVVYLFMGPRFLEMAVEAAMGLGAS
jgi:leader peptidase (prepilin peptidase)/N-methyltransferase